MKLKPSIALLALALTFSVYGQEEKKPTRGSSHEATPPAKAKAEQKPKDKKVKDDKLIRWETLQGLDYKSGKPSKELKSRLKKLVRIPGFVVPLDLYAKEAKEFLLVPTYGACIHTPPPPANQMIRVKMKKGNAPRRENGPVWVEGVISVTKTETPWGKAGFEITAQKTEPYKGGY